MLFLVASRSVFTPVTSPPSLFTSSELALVANCAFTFDPNSLSFLPYVIAANLFCLRAARSEEHTSELQSHLNLVCRLLLEKKKETKPSVALHTHKLADNHNQHPTSSPATLGTQDRPRTATSATVQRTSRDHITDTTSMVRD